MEYLECGNLAQQIDFTFPKTLIMLQQQLQAVGYLAPPFEAAAKSRQTKVKPVPENPKERSIYCPRSELRLVRTFRPKPKPRKSLDLLGNITDTGGPEMKPNVLLNGMSELEGKRVPNPRMLLTLAANMGPTETDFHTDSRETADDTGNIRGNRKGKARAGGDVHKGEHNPIASSQENLAPSGSPPSLDTSRFFGDIRTEEIVKMLKTPSVSGRS